MGFYSTTLNSDNQISVDFPGYSKHWAVTHVLSKGKNKAPKTSLTLSTVHQDLSGKITTIKDSSEFGNINLQLVSSRFSASLDTLHQNTTHQLIYTKETLSFHNPKIRSTNNFSPLIGNILYDSSLTEFVFNHYIYTIDPFLSLKLTLQYSNVHSYGHLDEKKQFIFLQKTGKTLYTEFERIDYLVLGLTKKLSMSSHWSVVLGGSQVIPINTRNRSNSQTNSESNSGSNNTSSSTNQSTSSKGGSSIWISSQHHF